MHFPHPTATIYGELFSVVQSLERNFLVYCNPLRDSHLITNNLSWDTHLITNDPVDGPLKNYYAIVNKKNNVKKNSD